LKNYAADIDRLKDPHITMVLRGFVDGMQKIKPTMQFVREIVNKDPQCSDIANCPVYDVTINVDPLLFSRYEINTVPAILYVNGVGSTDPQRSEGLADTTSIANAYIVYGDVSLEYALTVIEQQSQSSQIGAILTKLKEGFYH
jgi:conjugal transfer pilus assembly protein TrbC